MTVHHCAGSPCAICASQMGSATDRTGVLWNGPICQTCGARYLGSHTCSREDIARKIAELQALLGCPGCGQRVNGAHYCPGSQPSTRHDEVDQTRNCPCRPENGGSGVCGCILGGPQITYLTTPPRCNMGDRDDEPDSTHQRARRAR